MIEVRKDSLPPIECRSKTLYQIPYEPRRTYAVDLSAGDYGYESWLLNLVAIPMSSAKVFYKIQKRKTEDPSPNLQTWINNLGRALYNPLWFRINQEPPFWELISGTHRIRVLHALKFESVHAYLWVGPWRGKGFPDNLRPYTNTNNRAPIVSCWDTPVGEVYPEPI